jgi:predicted acyl esterase
VTVPVLSTANWGGQGLHTRGNFEGFVGAASPEKWLEAHGGAHWESFYTNKGMALQKKFFGHYLKGDDTGWSRHPRVQLQVRHVDKFVERDEAEWPLARTQWTKFYLDPSDCSLRTTAPQQATRLEYDTQGDGLMFLSAPLREQMEVTGPAAARLVVSSTTTDADLFLVLRVFTGDGREITFQGSNDPRTPIGLGWLRASHRKLDGARSLPYRPYHTHDEVQPLKPGQPVPLDIEIWPTSIVIPKGYRFGLSVRGKDYHYPGEPLKVAGFKYSLTGVGPFLHHHPKDRPADIFHTTNTLHFEPGDAPHLLLPVIPAAR